MSPNSHQGTPEPSVITTAAATAANTTTTATTSNKKTISQNSTSPSGLSKALPDSTPANAGPPALACPFPSCTLDFNGETSHGYLWRHLKRPGIYRRTGEEKSDWLRLHKIDHNRFIATGSITPSPPTHKTPQGCNNKSIVTPAQRKRESNRMRARKVSRAARFKSRARNMGITEESLVAQKIAIWEGMYAAEQSGDISLCLLKTKEYTLRKINSDVKV
ncbi:hypothetical protein HOY80DRAFT_1134987 [Tuber brumale]|nr:hypothetical protein HOY80DRAFT_1134987 [Tuber brumale]